MDYPLRKWLNETNTSMSAKWIHTYTGKYTGIFSDKSNERKTPHVRLDYTGSIVWLANLSYKQKISQYIAVTSTIKLSVNKKSRHSLPR